MLTWLRVQWCRRFHTRPMWPIHGRYTCPQCLRVFPVRWEDPKPQPETQQLKGAVCLENRE